MPDDRRLTIASTGRLTPDEVARRTFGTSRRGFDPAEVRAFLETVARDLHATAEREEEMRTALADAEHRAANPVLDEATLTASLGQETARILRTAHDASAELVGRAEADATRQRAEAQEEADQLRERAEQAASDRAAQAEAASADLRRRTQEEVASKLDAVRLEAEALTAQSRAECRAMVQEAQELRSRVLADLTKRRRILHSQIEQLRAGRERLAEAIGDARSSVNRIAEEVFRAEDEARLAAETAGRQAAAQPDALEGLGASEGAPFGSAAPEGAAPGFSSSSVTILGAAPAGAGGDAAAGIETAGSDLDDEDDGDRTQAVEELFARLRAERSVSPDEATGGSGSGAATDDASTEVAGAGIAGTEIIGAEAAVDVTDAGGADAPGTEPPKVAEAGADAGADAGSGDAGGDPLLARRDEVLVPVSADLARRLKRALQDDQNDVLDRLRSKGAWSDDVLPSEEEHRRRYVQATSGPLREAARVGAAFVDESASPPDATDIATELAISIVVPLRRRLSERGAAVDEGDEAALVEHVGSAYREWKGARVERLAGDQAVAAFSAATLAASPEGTSLSWVVDDDGDECPDCDDNALAGATVRGESFPTGHAHPPAHPGCRCLLAPATA
jgi:DivIVA domain-containing protein